METLALCDASYCQPDVTFLLMLALLGIVAGLVDSIAGGGGLLTLPVLIWLGIPPVQALATNKLQGTFGTMTASWHFYREGCLQGKRIWQVFLFAFIGSALGAWLVSVTDIGVLNHLIPFMLIAAAIYFLFSSRLSDVYSQARISFAFLLLIIIPLIGSYDGFFGPGTGSFFVLAYVGLMGMTAVHATAWAKLANFATNLAALLVFIALGKVLWLIGLTMAVGQIVGAKIGSSLVVEHGVGIVRPMLVIVSVLISAKLIVEQLGS